MSDVNDFFILFHSIFKQMPFEICRGAFHFVSVPANALSTGQAAAVALFLQANFGFVSCITAHHRGCLDILSRNSSNVMLDLLSKLCPATCCPLQGLTLTLPACPSRFQTLGCCLRDHHTNVCQQMPSKCHCHKPERMPHSIAASMFQAFIQMHFKIYLQYLSVNDLKCCWLAIFAEGSGCAPRAFSRSQCNSSTEGMA